MPAKTNYNPDGYNRESFSNIMQFIFADIMIREDREGKDGFFETNKEVVKIRRKIEAAYNSPANKDVLIQRVAEGVLLDMREGTSLEKILKMSNGALLKRGRKLASG